MRLDAPTPVLPQNGNLSATATALGDIGIQNADWVCCQKTLAGGWSATVEVLPGAEPGSMFWVLSREKFTAVEVGRAVGQLDINSPSIQF